MDRGRLLVRLSLSAAAAALERLATEATIDCRHSVTPPQLSDPWDLYNIVLFAADCDGSRRLASLRSAGEQNTDSPVISVMTSDHTRR